MCVPGASRPLTEHSKPDGTRDTNTGDSGGQRTKCRTQGAQEPGPARWPGPRVFPRAGRLATARSSLAGAGSAVACCSSHGKIGGPDADSAGQAEPGVPVTSYSEEPGAAAGQSHARPRRSHNLTLRATTRPLPPPPRRSHVVQAGNGDPAHCGLGAIDRDADPHPARRVRPHSCPRHARAMSRHRPRREVPARPRALTVSASRPPRNPACHTGAGGPRAHRKER